MDRLRPNNPRFIAPFAPPPRAAERGANEFLEAVRAGEVAAAEALLRADRGLVHARCGSSTPLHVAAANGDPEMTRLLLRNGADPAACDDERKTPIERALENGHVEIFELLRAATGGA